MNQLSINYVIFEIFNCVHRLIKLKQDVGLKVNRLTFTFLNCACHIYLYSKLNCSAHAHKVLKIISSFKVFHIYFSILFHNIPPHRFTFPIYLIFLKHCAITARAARTPAAITGGDSKNPYGGTADMSTDIIFAAP